MLPKLYRIAHPTTPYRVVFTGPEGKRRYRHFKDQEEAKTYHRELLAKAKVVGTVGLVMDQEMRAEYFAARQILDGVPIMTAVRYFLSHRPVGPSLPPEHISSAQQSAAVVVAGQPVESASWVNSGDGVSRLTAEAAARTRIMSK